MSGLKTPCGAIAAALALLAMPGPAAAQTSAHDETHTFTVSVLGGIGGSIDEDRAGYDNSAVQLGFSVVTDSRVAVGARLGTLGFGSSERVGDLIGLDVTYATVSGQYSFSESGYRSGVFLGLGVYRVEGNRVFTGQAVSTSELGVTLGASGDFDLTPRIGVVGELGAHVLPSADVQVFATGLVGLSFSW